MLNKNYKIQQENIDVNGGRSQERNIIVISLLCVTLSVVFHYVTSGWAVWSAVKVVSASLSLLIIPGVLLLLIIKLKSPLTILELSGLGAALSMGIITLVTIGCVLTHTTFSLIAMPLVICSFVLGLIALRQITGGGLTTIIAPSSELWLLLGLLVTAVLFFLLGSPLSAGEDQIHIAVARRLAVLAHPSIYNIYLTPAFVYTYPFPVTHVTFALTSILSGLDVMFVYHKMRFLWAIMAILCVYLSTKRIFDNSMLACVSGWTCIIFAANRAFGEASTLMWQQMAPFSHASDVAMGVLLPLLLVSTFYYLGSEHRRDTLTFFVIALLMCLTLTTAKIREIIQFIVYSAGFLAVIFLTKKNRFLVHKMAILEGATLVIVGFYVIYHRFMVASVASIVEVNKLYILRLWNSLSMLDYVSKPFNDGRIVNNFHLFYYDLNALALLGSPLVFFAFLRKQRLLLFLWASLFAYVLIIRFPVLSLPYLLLTYFDMLSSPVRNVIFFIYIMIGAVIYMMALFFSKLKPLALAIIILIGLAFSLSEFAERMREILMSQPDWLFLTLLIALPLAFWLSFTRWGNSFGRQWRLDESAFTTRAGVCAAILSVSLGGFLYKPAVALTIRESPIVTNLDQAIKSAAAPVMPIEYTVPASNKIIRVRGTSDVPSYDIIQWMKLNVPTDAVCAVNMFNGNILTAFVPQRVSGWPLGLYDPINYCINFPEYCKSSDLAFGSYGTQPFFNDEENKKERVKFIDDFGISYVVIDPSYYDMMCRVLGQYPELFIKVYDKEQWSVFKVNRS